jgi:hypothetical protein
MTSGSGRQGYKPHAQPRERWKGSGSGMGNALRQSKVLSVLHLQTAGRNFVATLACAAGHLVQMCV